MRASFSFTQPAGGYRANQDGKLLAEFAIEERSAKLGVDLGAGAGLVGLTLLSRGVSRIEFVENEASAAAAARENIVDNGFDERAEVHLSDVLKFARAYQGKADLIVTNPPYFEPGRGRVPKDPRRASARTGSVRTFVHAARVLAGPRSRVSLVYPAREAIHLVEELRSVGLEPKRLRFVHGRKEKPARVVLIEAQPGKRGGLVVQPPLIEHV